MVSSIQVSKDLLEELKQRKMYDKESYEDLIWDLIEDTKELSAETKRTIEKSEADIRAGRVSSMADVKKRLGL